MSEAWANRQRQTSKLSKLIGKYIFSKKNISPEQLYGIAKLSWTTRSPNALAYISSTKIPALENIFSQNYSSISIEDVAKDISEKIKNKEVEHLIQAQTGFTNFYNAYRNSVLHWISDNHKTLVGMYKKALTAKSDAERLSLISSITALPGIPKANHPENLLNPAYFLTPVFFTLDPEMKFPLINGSEGVRNLLRHLEVENYTLEEQYKAMVSLYGTKGINDAADLDQIGYDISDFITTKEYTATKKLLEEKETQEGKELPLKDEEDIETIHKAGTKKQRRIHNKLTNKFKKTLETYTLLEGVNKEIMFDVLIKDYNGSGNDLLVEAKSSTETANIRMAVGQLFDYWYSLNNIEEAHLAILLPNKPDKKKIKMLENLDIGVMWYKKGKLKTANKWLKHLAESS